MKYLKALIFFLALSFTFSVSAGVKVDKPTIPPEDQALGSVIGACYGVPAILVVGYDTNSNGAVDLILYFDKSGKLLIAMVYEDIRGGELLYAIVNTGNGYEKMDFDELVSRYPTPCDLTLKEG